MKFVCIMGRSNSGKSTVEKKLEKLGFKRSISYTTREPRVRDGELEKNGDNYRFVTRDKFKELLNNGTIIESAEYDGNLYGTPRPFGAKSFVAVVELNGFRALKELYGEQVVGVYLKCDESVAYERAQKRDNSSATVNKRKVEDNTMIAAMETESDIIIDANQDISKVTSDILKTLRDMGDE